MSEPNYKHEQIQAIKKRLNDARGGLTIYKLTEDIKEKTEFTNTHYNTVQSTLNHASDALDISVVIAICRLLHLDTAYVLSPPGTPDPGIPNNQLSVGKFTLLDDPKYFGTFHGFFYSPNHRSPELVRFDLIIEKTKDSASATMLYHGRPQTVHGTVEPDERTLHGVPCLCVRHSNIYIQLTDDMGDFYYLYFNRQEFRSHNLYFRRGIALTGSSLGSHPALQLNFVLFAREVPDEKLKYIPGLLADVNRTFYISKSKLDEVRNEEPIVESFYTSFRHILDHDAKQMYPINEAMLLQSASSSSMSPNDVVKALLLLKASSSAPNRTVYEDIEDYSSFSKNVLQQPGDTELH